MVWSLAVRSFCMLVWLVMSVSWTHVSGQRSVITLSSEFKGSKESTVLTAVYSAGTPISYLVNESRRLSYLPFCHHSHPDNVYILELYRNDTKTVISRSDGPVAGAERIYWPPSALYPNDSATYQCRTSPTDVADESFLLSVVVSVNITRLDIGKVFVNRSFLVTCCADGYPEPSVAINDTEPSHVNITKSNGIFTTCHTVNWSAPVKYGKVYVMCKAELAPFNCTTKPPAAHTLCAATTTKTNTTKTTIANQQSCAPLDKPHNGIFKCSDENKFLSECRLICNSGFEAKSNTTSQCLGTGRFSSPVRVCVDIDECTTQPCKNGGTCNNTVGNYTCTCAPGWTGRNCTEDIDECAAQPCKNGSTCANTVGNYTCACAPGWTGRNCTKDQNCIYGELVGNKCDCVFGWKGASCDEADWGVMIGSTIAGCIIELIIFVISYVVYRKLKKCPDSVPPGMNRKNFKEWEERDLELDRLEQEAQQNSKDNDEAAGTSASGGSYNGEEYARLMRSDQKQQQPTSAAGGETYAQLNRKIAPQYEDANPGHPVNIEMAHLPAQYDRLDRDGKPAPPKTTTNINYEYTKANFPAPSEAAGNEADLNYAALEKKEPSTFDYGVVAAGKTVYSQIVPMSQQNQSESEN